MFERLLVLILGVIADLLMKRVAKAAEDYKDKLEKDEINKENAEAYQLQQDRLEKIKHAKNLLNGVKHS